MKSIVLARLISTSSSNIAFQLHDNASGSTTGGAKFSPSQFFTLKVGAVGKTFRFWAVAVVVSIGLMGCVTSPANLDAHCPGLAFPVRGYAQNPGATVLVRAYNLDTGTWEVVASTMAETSPTTFGSNTLYSWWTPVTLADRHFTTFAPDVVGKIQVTEVGGIDLITFDQGGVGCVVDKMINQNLTWFAAGYQCRSASSPVISLSCPRS